MVSAREAQSLCGEEEQRKAKARVGKGDALSTLVDLRVTSLLEVGEGSERHERGGARGGLGGEGAAGHAGADLEGVGRHEEGGEGSDAVQHGDRVEVCECCVGVDAPIDLLGRRCRETSCRD